MTQENGIEPAGQGEWLAFLREPAAYAAPERLAPCFAGAVSWRGCERLLAEKRLRPRLSALLRRQYDLPSVINEAEEDFDPDDRLIALSSGERVADLVLRAGAIYWANTIAGAVLGREAAALRTALGGELCALAVANKDIAGPPQPIGPVETLRDRVEGDGWKCLAAWRHAVDPAIGARFRLKLPLSAPLDDAPEESFAASGPAIVRRAVH
ncbi:SctK family type III secretion system sorting platform protein [Chelativorans alearense]|uniref:SctK family type III secretion system sorting platform protein n=1 Tax=Chelativorans alearense TaxID=2681495 RepID=UPI0013D52686|nr:SctK family type III secretion system sorting platform protein [Chelativorans alearense]